MTSNQPKKIHVNSSTLVDLKAELLRKQQEFRKERSSSKAGFPTVERRSRNENKEKGSIWSKSNAGVLERAQRDIEARQEEDATLEKSRSTLEAKAKLYERIANSNEKPEDDNGELFLVDFERKAMNDRLQERLEERAKEEKEEEEEMKKALNEPLPQARNEEEEWVDYVDQFGKSRRCLRKDLEDLQGQVKPLKIRGESELLSEDMKRELQRQKWEQEEEALLQGPNGPIHYSNVQFDEIRAHGVGYYQFSKDQEERKEQMEKLQKLRQQTMEQQEKKERIKEKRKAIMAARLAKVKQRRMITTTVDSDSDEQEEEEVKKEVKVVEPIIRDDSWRKDAPVREWDKGKKADMDWMHHNREERNNDFAPPSIYYDSNPRETSMTSQASCSIRPEQSQPPKNVHKIETQVDTLLSRIRSGTENVKSSDTGEIADIPLPQEKNIISENRNEQLVKEIPSSFIPFTAPPPMTAPPPGYHATNPQMAVHPPGVYATNQWVPPPQNFDPTLFSQPPPGYPNYNYPGYPNQPYNLIHPNSNTEISPPGTCSSASVAESLYNEKDSPTAASSTTVPERQSVRHLSSADVELSEVTSPDVQSTEVMQDSVESEPETSKTSIKSSSSKSTPATYSSQPVRYAKPGMELGKQDDGTVVAPAPQKSTYERVNLHEVPRSLPMPPSLVHKPSYPSQENVIAMNEKKAEKNWMKQYGAPQRQGQNSSVNKSNLPTTDKIPFQSPYVQKSDDSSEPFKSDVDFDPSVPPPSIKKD